MQVLVNKRQSIETLRQQAIAIFGKEIANRHGVLITEPRNDKIINGGPPRPPLVLINDDSSETWRTSGRYQEARSGASTASTSCLSSANSQIELRLTSY